MKQLLTSEIKLIGERIKKELNEGNIQGIHILAQSQDILLRAIADTYGIDEEQQEWPEGASNDNPGEDAPDERKEKEKKGGFFA